MMHSPAPGSHHRVEGEIYAVMDKSETLLKRGDVLLKCGTNHSWSNRSDQPCIIAAVLVSADRVT